MQDWLASAIKTIAEYKILIAAILLSITMSGLKSLQNKRKLDWIESLICGCLTLAIYSILEYMKLPKEIGVFFGGIIGFKGSLWFGKFINNRTGIDEGGK